MARQSICNGVILHPEALLVAVLGAGGMAALQTRFAREQMRFGMLDAWSRTLYAARLPLWVVGLLLALAGLLGDAGTLLVGALLLVATSVAVARVRARAP